MSPIRLLCVDDSPLIREVLTQIFSTAPDIEVVGTAPDPYVAWDMLHKLNPDVLTLDVEMPRMDGITFLDKLMRARPTPVVMVSSLTESGCDITLRSLELGAIDFVTKPKFNVHNATWDLADELLDKVRVAARARLTPGGLAAAEKRSKERTTPASKTPAATPNSLATAGPIIAIGASTGGTDALADMLSGLPADSPGIVIVQHMPERFTTAFAARLDKSCSIRVREAAHNDPILAGQALLAPGNHHMSVIPVGGRWHVAVTDEPPVNRHRPSVDFLFASCAKHLKGKAVGVILTGMGDDGARGMRAMRDAGAHTIAQDEATCVVFGMPKEAIAMGGVEKILPLKHIATAALQLARPAK